MEKICINNGYLEGLLLPLGYEADFTQEKPMFWKVINQNDRQSPYAFSLVIITLDRQTIIVEGLNEPRLQRAIRAGAVEVNSEEEVENLKEIVFKTTLNNRRRLEVVLPFFEQQLQTIEKESPVSDAYKRALANIQLLVDAAQTT